MKKFRRENEKNKISMCHYYYTFMVIYYIELNKKKIIINRWAITTTYHHHNRHQNQNSRAFVVLVVPLVNLLFLFIVFCLVFVCVYGFMDVYRYILYILIQSNQKYSVYFKCIY